MLLIRSIAVGGLALISLASVASAESYFVHMGRLPTEAMLELGTITSDGDGVVEIYNYRFGEKGKMLGSFKVNAGANPDVRFDIGMPPLGNLLAILNVGGKIVATHVYHLDHH